MFAKKIIFSGFIVLLLTSYSLVSGQSNIAERQEIQMERQEREPEFYFAPLPSFNQMFSALDYLDIRDFDMALEREVFKVDEEVYQVAFALGVNTADAIMATKGRNSEKLNQIASLMINYARFLGLSEEILKLGEELHRMVESGDWDMLIDSLERYREEVELSLYESRQYDLFTMMQLGGWTQGLNRTAYLLTNNYNREKSSIIDQKGILNSLINNLEHVRDEHLHEQEYYALSNELYHQIRDIIYAEENVYSEEAVRELYNLTDTIKKTFR
jgi:hypothetical protein